MTLPGTIDGSSWTAATGVSAGDIGINAITNGTTIDIVDPGTGDSDKYLQAADGAKMEFDISADADRLGSSGVVYRQSLVLYAEKTGTPVKTQNQTIHTTVFTAGGSVKISMGYELDSSSQTNREGLGFHNPLQVTDRLRPMGPSQANDIQVDLNTRFTFETVMLRNASTGYFAIYLNGKCLTVKYGLDTNTSSPQAGWEITLPAITGIRWRVYPSIVGVATVATRQHQADTGPGNMQWHLCPAIGGDHGDFDFGTTGNATLTRTNIGSNANNTHRTLATLTTSSGVATATHTSAFDIGALTFYNGYATIMLGECFVTGVAHTADTFIKLQVRNAANDGDLATITLFADGDIDDAGGNVLNVVDDKRYNIGLVLGEDGTTWVWAYEMTTDNPMPAVLAYTAAGNGWTVGDIGKIIVTLSHDAADTSGNNSSSYCYVLVVAPMVWSFPDSLQSGAQAITNFPNLRTLTGYGTIFQGQFESGSVPNGKRTGYLEYGVADWAMSAGGAGASHEDLNTAVTPLIADLRGVRAVNMGVSINDITDTRSASTQVTITADHDAFVTAFLAGSGNEVWWATDVRRPLGEGGGQTWTQAEMDILDAINEEDRHMLARHDSARVRLFDVSKDISVHEELFTAATDDVHPNNDGYKELKLAFGKSMSGAATTATSKGGSTVAPSPSRGHPLGRSPMTHVASNPFPSNVSAMPGTA